MFGLVKGKLFTGPKWIGLRVRTLHVRFVREVDCSNSQAFSSRASKISNLFFEKKVYPVSINLVYSSLYGT